MNRRKISSALITFLLLLSFMPALFNFIPTADASVAWYDHAWHHRAEITITGSTIGALTDYPLMFDLFYADGTNSDNDVYTNGYAQSDYADVIFVADDQLTLLSHWLTDNSSWIDPNATVWVKVPSIPASPTLTIFWIYYDNPVASSTSDGSEVFPFFDDFLTDPATNADWTVVEGGTAPSEILHEDWRISIIEGAASGGWAYLKGAEDLVLSGGSSVYGWSMEFDGTVYHSGGNEVFCYYGAALADELTHVNLAFDGITSGVDWYWRSADPIANRYFTYDESNATNDILQSNGTVTPWGYGTNAAAPVDWTQYQIALFNETSYVSINGTEYRTMSSLDSDYLIKGLDPSFSAHGKAGDAAVIRGYVNWVFMRPLANPEPTPLVGESEGVDLVAGLHNPDGCGDFVHEGEKAYIFYINVSSEDATGSGISAGIGFSDYGDNFFSFYYSSSTEQLTIVNPGFGIFVGDYDVSTGTEWVYINFTVYFNKAILDTQDIDLYVSWNIPGIGSSGWYIRHVDYFGIYNAGGLTTLETSGDADRVTGGDIFELYAYNNSYAQSNTTYRNLQHWTGYVRLYGNKIQWDTEEGDPWNFTFGIYICPEGEEWINGWKVTMRLKEVWLGGGWFANDAYRIVWDILWYERDSGTGGWSLIRTDMFSSFPVWDELSASVDLYTGLYFDFWFNSANASSVFGGRVNAENFGVTGAGLFPWDETWDPVFANLTQSMFFRDLKNTAGEIIQSDQIVRMKPFARIEQGVNAARNNSISLREYDIFDFRRIEGEHMNGVGTPIVTSTMMPLSPSLGFLGSLVVAFGFIMNPILEALNLGWVSVVTVLDEVAGFLGMPGAVSTFFELLDGFFLMFSTAITQTLDLFTPVVTIISDTFLFIVDILTRTVSVLILIANGVKAILDGTSTVATGVGSIWTWIEIGDWVDAIPLFGVISWFMSIDQRNRRSQKFGGQGWMSIFFGDIQAIMAVFSFIINLTMNIINVVLDGLFRVAQLIRG